VCIHALTHDRYLAHQRHDHGEQLVDAGIVEEIGTATLGGMNALGLGLRIKVAGFTAGRLAGCRSLGRLICG
jgi:hypothetical protein